MRADHIYEPGMITTDIIDRLSEVDLVIADLTTTNFNVAYELAIRHSVRKPVIQISHSYGELPFDIQGIRTITFVYGNAKSMISCREEISKYIEFIEANPSKVDSPVTQATVLQAIKQGDEPNKEFLLQLQSQIETLSAKVDDIKAYQTFRPKVLQPGEAPRFSGQNVTLDPATIKLGTSQSLGWVIVNPSLGNIIRGPNVIGEPTFWSPNMNKKPETDDEENK